MIFLCFCHRKLIGFLFHLAVYVLHMKKKNNGRWKIEKNSRHTDLCQQRVPSTPFIFSLPLQDVIIAANMLPVTHLQYLSWFMCKNKIVFLRSCKSKKGEFDIWTTALSRGSLNPALSLYPPSLSLMPVTLSGLMCLLIASIQASQRSRDPQPDIAGLSFGATC